MISMDERVMGWHFLADDGSRRDGEKPAPGGTEDYDGPLLMCQSGLHASRRPLDALGLAPGSLIRRVECWGDIVMDGDKFICRHRRELWRLDITRILHEFARRVAPPQGPRGTPQGAAWNAAWDAARNAAWYAARDATRDATRAAAWDAARNAAWDKYNGWLQEMIMASEEARRVHKDTPAATNTIKESV